MNTQQLHLELAERALKNAKARWMRMDDERKADEFLAEAERRVAIARKKAKVSR